MEEGRRPARKYLGFDPHDPESDQEKLQSVGEQNLGNKEQDADDGADPKLKSNARPQKGQDFLNLV